jgi:hypothetical protein
VVVETNVVIIILPFGVILAYAIIPNHFYPCPNGPIKSKVVMLDLNA